MQEKDRDFLQLYRAPNKTEPLFTAFTGPAQAWPRVPIIVEGDTVVFHFTSDPFNTYWGYRCIVTGVILESSFVPLWELERTVGWLVGTSLSTLVVGRKNAKHEDVYAKWLDSSLFAGGLSKLAIEGEPMELETHDAAETEKVSGTTGGEEEVIPESELAFLNDLVENKPDSAASALFREKWKQMPDMFDNYGGELVDEVMRWFVSVSLRLLRLTATAMKKEERSEAEEKQLNGIWREAKNLRKWIVHERQRLANEISEKQKLLEAVNAAQATSAETTAASGSTTSTESTTSSSAAGSSSTAGNDKGKGKEKATSTEEEPAAPAVDKTSYEYMSERLVSKFKLLNQTIPCGGAVPTAQLIADFAKQTPDEQPLRIIQRREERARGRVRALNAVQSLMRSVRMLSVKQDLLRVVGPSLRKIKEISGGDATGQQSGASTSTAPSAAASSTQSSGKSTPRGTETI